MTAFKSRPAAVGDKLTTKNFGMGTRGFCDPADPSVAVCVLPGTEIAFDETPKAFGDTQPDTNVARFRQINKDNLHTHHDALEFGDGKFVLLTYMQEGQTATVLQLPAAPKNETEAKEQTRLEAVG